MTEMKPLAARTNMFAVYGSMTAQPGRRDAVVELIRKAARVGGYAGD